VSFSPVTKSDSPAVEVHPFSKQTGEGMTAGDQGEVSAPKPEAGRVYRSQRRPGLTALGVAIIGGAVSLVSALLNVLITDSLGWLFAVPFVLISGYCAAEVRQDRLRSALIMPPLVLLLVTIVVPLVTGDVSSARGWVVHTATLLTRTAPELVAAVALAAGILAWRRWRSR